MRVLAWEMVGYGNSWAAGDGRDISVKAQAHYLLDWLDVLAIDRAVFAGHDLGGGVAQIAAVRSPDRCAGLVLTNSIGYDSWPIPMVKALAAIHPMVARLPRALLRRLLAGFIRPGHDSRERTRESIQEHLEAYDHRGGATAFARQLRSLRTEDTLEVAPRLPELGIPAAVVWGASDRFQTLDYGRRLAGDLAAELEIVEHGKHFMPEDHPDELVAAIHRVLTEADVPTAGRKRTEPRAG